MSDDVDDVSDITAFYNSDPEREHARLEEHQLEYELTWRYLDKYLPTQGKILEVGAATGRYTLKLAKQGYEITAVDISAGLIEECKNRIAREELEGQVRFLVSDARDLGIVGEQDFDAVLLMGPLYHLVEEADRRQALKEARKRLRKGGFIFTAFISRFGIMAELLRNLPGWIEDQTEVSWLLQNGRRPEGYPKGGFRGYFARVSEIVPLHDSIGFETLELVGVEPAISADDESYNRLQGNQRQLWLDLLYELSKEPSILGASRHLLYIGKRAG